MKKRKKEKKFNLNTLGVVFGLAAWVGISLVASQFAMSYLMYFILGDAVTQPVWTTVFSGLTYILCLVLVILVPWKLMKTKTNREEMGLMGLPTWTDILLSPVGFVVYLVIAMLLMAIMGAIFPNVDWGQAQEVGYSGLFGVSDRILAFVALVVIAPVAEELIFRGWLYGKVRSKVPAWVGILVVSVLFGVLHLGFDVNALQWNVAVNVFCMSVVMCLMREITGTIWGGMVLHILKNGVAFYLLYINGSY